MNGGEIQKAASRKELRLRLARIVEACNLCCEGGAEVDPRHLLVDFNTADLAIIFRAAMAHFEAEFWAEKQ